MIIISSRDRLVRIVPVYTTPKVFSIPNTNSFGLLLVLNQWWMKFGKFDKKKELSVNKHRKYTMAGLHRFILSNCQVR